MQWNQQQTLLFQLWVSTGVCNQYEWIGQQETTATIRAALTRPDPLCLPENSEKPQPGWQQRVLAALGQGHSATASQAAGRALQACGAPDICHNY